MSGFRNIIIENPSKLSYKGSRMVITSGEKTCRVHLSEIGSVVLKTNEVYISAYLLAELAKAKVALITSDQHHNPVGQYLPLYGAHNTSKRIKEQIDWGEPTKKRVWQRIVKDKIQHQSDALKARARNEQGKLLAKVIPEVRSGDVTNREAYSAKVYFESLFGNGFSRVEDTPVNAALNYGYAILLSTVNHEIVSRGYLTQIGICHRNEFNQFNLSCDFMEPFRPIVDLLVFDNVEEDFTSDTKNLLVDMLNLSIPYKGGIYRCSSVISLYITECFKALNKRLSIDEIEPFDVV